jgi:hypothetical protein
LAKEGSRDIRKNVAKPPWKAPAERVKRATQSRMRWDMCGLLKSHFQFDKPAIGFVAM